MKRRTLAVAWAATIITSIFTPVISAQNDIEDPSAFPGVWYRIVFDEDGNYFSGDGDGSGWTYYPSVDRYRMWFYNGAYDPDRKGYLNYQVYIKAVDRSESTYAEVYFNWTTPEWSALGRNHPPTPDDVPTMSEESQYISDSSLITVDNWNIGTVEPIRSYTIGDYNPEWVSIDIIGRNAYIYRGAFHECLPKEPQMGACCDRATGECYLTLASECESPFEWLGAGTSCQDCSEVAPPDLLTDFGDAPDSMYRTLRANNGPSHILTKGLFLGQGVDAEPDGQPNETATGDDENGNDEDGVEFTTPLLPGQTATIEVTASSEGYLNAWVDFNGNGSFGDAGEQVFQDELLTNGVNQLTVRIPAEAATGTSFARFRFNSRGLLGYDGPASDGEVEDYSVQIAPHFEPQPASGLTSLLWNQLPSPVQADQPYDFSGWSTLSNLHLHQAAADDWQAEGSQPITGIHWWGSFEGWNATYLPPTMPLAFHIGIWTDAPDLAPKNPNTYNHPGTLIWETLATNWTWAVGGHLAGDQGIGTGEACFQFSHLLSQNEWFTPASGPDAAFYWISISAIYDPQTPPKQYLWGWMTRPHTSSEGAVLIQDVTPPATDPAAPNATTWPPTLGAEWQHGIPLTGLDAGPWDMAFQLTTFAPLAMPPLEVERNSVKPSEAKEPSPLVDVRLRPAKK